MSTINEEVTIATNASSRLISAIAGLARHASVEINVQDEKYLEQSQAHLRPGTRVYVSHLPGQSWGSTIQTCAAVREAGFEPVPHVPVRLIESDVALHSLLDKLRKAATASEILLISGDYAQPAGPYHAVSQVIASGALEQHGFDRVSVAGHPEGHPKVALENIREAEREKVEIAVQHGLQAALVTQFLFEPEPFLQWVASHRAQGLKTRYICGLAGPAKISTLLRYAIRCGVGNSIRALNSRHASLRNLLGDHGPDHMLRELAMASLADDSAVNGIHLFCFGGFLKTVQWLQMVATGRITLSAKGGFEV